MMQQFKNLLEFDAQLSKVISLQETQIVMPIQFIGYINNNNSQRFKKIGLKIYGMIRAYHLISNLIISQKQQTNYYSYKGMQSQLQSIRQAFSLSQPSCLFSQVEGYRVPKKEVNPTKAIQQRQMAKLQKNRKSRKKTGKRGSFIQDQLKIHNTVPGPGKYPIADQWPKKAKLKTRCSQKYTFIQQIFRKQKKENSPAPGFYNVCKSLKEEQKEAKKYSLKKVGLDRTSYLDTVQFDANASPGVGVYNIRGRSRTQMSFSKYNLTPEDWRQKHTQSLLKQKKKSKVPSATSYSPQPSDFTLFSTLSKSKIKNGFGKMARFKTTICGSGISPMKYNILQEWRGKSKKIERHGFEVLYKARAHTSVYHD